MKTITTMMKQLKKKFPDKYISIEKVYEIHSFTNIFEISYVLYVSLKESKMKLTYENLIEKVDELLKEE